MRRTGEAKEGVGTCRRDLPRAPAGGPPAAELPASACLLAPFSSAMWATRMQRELAQLTSAPPPGVVCYPADGASLQRLEAQLSGPPGTVYEGGVFKLEVRIPDRCVCALDDGVPCVCVPCAACLTVVLLRCGVSRLRRYPIEPPAVSERLRRARLRLRHQRSLCSPCVTPPFRLHTPRCAS